ncbi:unnamed protein product, partial [Ectocarpus sp. 12 AP-2014]
MLDEKEVTVYTIEGCSACDQALDYLRKREVTPSVLPVERETPEVAELIQTTGCSTFPQIFVDSVFIGGLSDL